MSYLLLALVQGATEFLPVSSSAHLVLLPRLFSWQDQGLGFDVAVHFGSLAGVVAYFRHDLRRLFCAAWRHGTRGFRPLDANADAVLAWQIAAATVPILVVGSVGRVWVEQWLREPLVIAWATLGFALLLGYAAAVSRPASGRTVPRWKDALWMGVCQVLALIPGASRSGVVLTAGLLAGLHPVAAARFSFLLSVPVITAAACFEGARVWHQGIAVDWLALGSAVALAALAAYLGIHVFLLLLQRIGVWPFVVYRILLGGMILWFLGN